MNISQKLAELRAEAQAYIKDYKETGNPSHGICRQSDAVLALTAALDLALKQRDHFIDCSTIAKSEENRIKRGRNKAIEEKLGL